MSNDFIMGHIEAGMYSSENLKLGGAQCFKGYFSKGHFFVYCKILRSNVLSVPLNGMTMT